MIDHRRITAFTAALLMAVSLSVQAAAINDGFELEIIPETGDVDITIITGKDNKKISPYIYGINDSFDISDVTSTVIKQTGTELSTYNWETNFSNPGISGMNVNDIALVSDYSSDKWSVPALYTESLISKSIVKDISVRLVTLPMMGYVARDSMGIVSADEIRSSRWCTTRFNKNDTYLNQPDTEDDIVYIDEYVSYLVNRYGTSSEGGINGYFLDSEPDKWHQNFSVLELDPITPGELVNRSKELAYSVKTIDRNAFVFGPSLSGIQSCVNLGSSSSWAGSREADSEYSWFIDYYLSKMRAAGEETGFRLLDSLDIHYYCESLTPMGTDILSSEDDYSNAYRMQAVRTLWDPDYTENSTAVLMNKQFTPFIPMLQASIRINYPNTRLSFSEYNFGGGSHISGAIAQADALGVFASQDVFLACLNPSTEDFSYQKAAINLYTNYDGNNSGFGNTLVYSDNGNDSMSSVYAAVDSNEPEKLRIILINKNSFNNKNFYIDLYSDEFDYKISEAYLINDESPSIEEISTDFIMTTTDGKMYFNAETTSIYMLVLDGTEIEEQTEETSVTDETDNKMTDPSETTPTFDVILSEPESTVNPADDTVADLTQSITASSAETTESSYISESRSAIDTSDITEPADPEEKKVPIPVKIIVSLLAVTAGLGILYVLVFDKK